MKTTAILKTVALTAATVVWPFDSPANDVARCDKVFEEVRATVEKDPLKVLIAVEDAMVAHETCACEIVKGAIAGAKANADLTRQIVLAATHIAPQMASLIADCAGVPRPPEGGTAAVASTTPDQNPGTTPDRASSPDSEAPFDSGDYTLIPDDIRGVYLIQPATGGFAANTLSTDTSGASGTSVVKRLPPKQSVPQSPSVAQGP